MQISNVKKTQFYLIKKELEQFSQRLYSITNHKIRPTQPRSYIGCSDWLQDIPELAALTNSVEPKNTTETDCSVATSAVQWLKYLLFFLAGFVVSVSAIFAWRFLPRRGGFKPVQSSSIV